MSSSDKEETGPAAFFKWIKQGVAETVKPLPAALRMSFTQEPEPEPKKKIPVTPSGAKKPAASSFKTSQYDKLLSQENIDLNALRELSWTGIPVKYRAEVWQMLLGYMPVNKSRRDATIARKRKEYLDSVPIYFKKSTVTSSNTKSNNNSHDEDASDRTTQEGEILRQIQVDLPRTCPNTPFFHQEPIQRVMERVLYIWAIRHPASGYVQGMNDLLTPLLLVAIGPYVADALRCDVATLDPNILANVEADAYWCLTKLLDNIQDHYTFSQPGLQRMVLRLEDLNRRIDKPLHDHFNAEGLLYMQFSFRWMNCALLRELPLKAIMRLWDTYFAEEQNGFENFHVYVCAVLLKIYSPQLMKMQFQDALMFLQDLPTAEWGEDDVESILSQAYILNRSFDDSPSHLVDNHHR